MPVRLDDVKIFFVFCLFAVYSLNLKASLPVQGDQTTLHLQSRRYTQFSLFQEITKQTGYLFVYDSELLPNDRPVSISRGTTTLASALDMVIGEKKISYRIVDNYIIFYPHTGKPSAIAETQSSLSDTLETVPEKIIVSGRIIDAVSGEPLSFATIQIPNQARGIAANADAIFRLQLPASFLYDTLKISFIGHTPRLVPITIVQDLFTDIPLSPEPVSLQEIVVSAFEPGVVLQRAISRIPHLYSQRPVILHSFYREGITKEDELVGYSEAVFEMYKAAYGAVTSDQVRLIKSRNITNADNTDTLMIKLKAGVQSVLELDVIKNPTDFLTPNLLGNFVFPWSGLVWHNSRLLYEISFQSAGFSRDDMYEGVIYVDKETLAIVQVDFEITRSYLRNHQNRFFIRRSNQHITSIRSVKYSVSYGLHDGSYHIKHIRGDISMRIRERSKLRGSNYNAFFEMSTMHLQTEDVRRFPRRETFRTRSVFSDLQLGYDPDFWEDFNYIIPERRIIRAIDNARIVTETSLPEE